MMFDLPLIAAGVPESEIEDCLEWAFGEDWETLTLADSLNRWNERHEDKLHIYPSEEVMSAIRKIGRTYLEWNT